LKFAKKGCDTPTVTRAEALEVALCYGWIDGQAAPYDDSYWLQRFTPRRPQSKWSQINRDAATALIEAGKMRASGLKQVHAAQEDGRWEAAYEPQSRATVPEDFEQALARNPAAKAFFQTLTGVSRYAFLYRIHDAKRPETRAARVAKYVEMLAERRTLH
jgi:uncharacterized protein YdeI (YjbR/CyaY-like superfamily)